MTTSGRTANNDGAIAGQAAAGAAQGRAVVDGGHVRDSDFVQSLDRGLAGIRAFGPGRERLSLSEVARATGLTRAGTRRFRRPLVQLGYVQHDGLEVPT